jgi:biopolymer transport protein ExbB/TolQ
MKKWITVLIVGIILALGPLWGLAGTVFRMIMAFDTMGLSGGSDPGALAADISHALHTTVAGYVAFPIGIALVTVATIKVVKARQRAETVEAT